MRGGSTFAGQNLRHTVWFAINCDEGVAAPVGPNSKKIVAFFE